MLEDPMWPAAHWFALTSAMLAVWGIWLLLDGGWARSSVAARAGSRLVIAAGIFMAVQFSVEIGARSAIEIYAEGRPAPLVDLVDPMQAVGWPALAVGFILIAIGVPGSAPRWVIILGIVGAGALGVAGVLAQGLHLLQAAPLFIGGNLLAVWMMWAGLRVARRAVRFDGSRETAPA